MIDNLFEINLDVEKSSLEEVEEQPNECSCGCLFYTDHTVDQIDHIVLEYDRICDDCGNVLGRWVTGSWQTD